MAIIIDNKYNKNDTVWVIESFYKEPTRIVKVNIDCVMAQAEMPPGHDCHPGMCDISSDKIRISYLLSNGWFAEEKQLFPTLEEAVGAFNNDEHKRYIS